jgi:hypothetical protein
MEWTRILAYITGTVDQELLLRNEYLAAENGILKAQLTPERSHANLASDFDPRTFGFRKLSDLVRRTNSFEIDHPKGGSMRIGTKSAAGSPPKSKTVTKTAT